MHEDEPAAQRAEARRWLAIVEEDLAAAKLCLGAELATVAAYHAQQALEKAVKAWLVAFGKTFRRTHSIDELAGDIAGIDAGMCERLTRLAWVTAWNSAYRYPAEEPEVPPSHQDIGVVLNLASEFSRRLLDRLSADQG